MLHNWWRAHVTLDPPFDDERAASCTAAVDAGLLSVSSGLTPLLLVATNKSPTKVSMICSIGLIHRIELKLHLRLTIGDISRYLTWPGGAIRNFRPGTWLCHLVFLPIWPGILIAIVIIWVSSVEDISHRVRQSGPPCRALCSIESILLCRRLLRCGGLCITG